MSKAQDTPPQEQPSVENTEGKTPVSPTRPASGSQRSTALYESVPAESTPPWERPSAPVRPKGHIPSSDTMVLKMDDILEEASSDDLTDASLLPPKPLPPLDFPETEKIHLSGKELSGVAAIRARPLQEGESTDPMVVALGGSQPHSTMELDMNDMVEEVTDTTTPEDIPTPTVESSTEDIPAPPTTQTTGRPITDPFVITMPPPTPTLGFPITVETAAPARSRTVAFAEAVPSSAPEQEQEELEAIPTLEATPTLEAAPTRDLRPDPARPVTPDKPRPPVFASLLEQSSEQDDAARETKPPVFASLLEQASKQDSPISMEAVVDPTAPPPKPPQQDALSIHQPQNVVQTAEYSHEDFLVKVNDLTDMDVDELLQDPETDLANLNKQDLDALPHASSTLNILEAETMAREEFPPARPLPTGESFSDLIPAATAAGPPPAPSVRPALVPPAQPASKIPAKPATVTPTKPASEAPGKPATEVPTKPATVTPMKPASEAPVNSASTSQATPDFTPPSTSAPAEVAPDSASHVREQSAWDIGGLPSSQTSQPPRRPDNPPTIVLIAALGVGVLLIIAALMMI